MSTKRKLYIRTYGCQMNEYDSLKMAKVLEASHDRTSDVANADLVLINTCSVRDKPEQKLYSLLGELHELKQINPQLMIGVGGCVAQQEGDTILKRSKDVDFVFGTHNLSLIPGLIDQRKRSGMRQAAVNYREDWEELPFGFPEDGSVVAFLAISRGCNKSCTYCIVPTTRGPEVSRATEEIEREVRMAVHRGVREIVLLGQTVNSYGLDLTPRSSFVKLLERISAIDKLERIRFTSPHPQEVREDFIDLVCSNPKICRHIHMPLQSGSDRILKAMNRNYRRAKYLAIIEALKARVPDMAITTDIIVGFPGETEDDFQATLEVLEQVQFDMSYSFVYSPRPGTVAAEMPDPVSYDIKLARLQQLQARQFEIAQARLKAWVGRTAEILVEGPSTLDPKTLQGRTSQNILVNLNREYPGIKPGMLVPVLITQSARYTLKADLIDLAENRSAGSLGSEVVGNIVLG